MILVAELEVAPPKSPASTRTTLSPRNRASTAQAAPTAPPPMMHRSKAFPEMFCRTVWRDFTHGPRQGKRGAIVVLSEYLQSDVTNFRPFRLLKRASYTNSPAVGARNESSHSRCMVMSLVRLEPPTSR